MSFDSELLWAFLLVFVRGSATFMSSPVFGTASIPVQIRIMAVLALSGALAMCVRPFGAELPQSLGELALALGNEVASGLLLGTLSSMALMAIQFAGSLLDMQVGLGMSQVLNPVTGVSSSVLAQFKSMLALVVFVGVQGHHFVLQAFVKSYEAMPMLTAGSMEPLREGFVGLVAAMSVLALQVAAPVAAVGLIVDTAMGIVNRAVPQMPVFLVGLPLKIAASMLALSVALPALVFGVQSGIDQSAEALGAVWRGSRSSAAPTLPELSVGGRDESGDLARERR